MGHNIQYPFKIVISVQKYSPQVSFKVMNIPYESPQSPQSEIYINFYKEKNQFLSYIIIVSLMMVYHDKHVRHILSMLSS